MSEYGAKQSIDEPSFFFFRLSALDLGCTTQCLLSVLSLFACEKAKLASEWKDCSIEHLSVAPSLIKARRR
jgi:hypothetical protein